MKHFLADYFLEKFADFIVEEKQLFGPGGWNARSDANAVRCAAAAANFCFPPFPTLCTSGPHRTLNQSVSLRRSIPKS